MFRVAKKVMPPTNDKCFEYLQGERGVCAWKPCSLIRSDGIWYRAMPFQAATIARPDTADDGHEIGIDHSMAPWSSLESCGTAKSSPKMLLQATADSCHPGSFLL